MKNWIGRHKKAVWIIVISSAAILALTAAVHFSRIFAEQKRAGLFKAAYEKDVLAEYTKELRLTELKDIVVTPSYSSGDGDRPLWNRGSFDSLYVTYTYSSEEIDRYYSEEYGGGNAEELNRILNEILKKYYAECSTYSTDINGRECRMYHEYGVSPSLEVSSASHMYKLWCFDGSTSVDIDSTTVYYHSDQSAGSSKDSGKSKDSAKTGSSSGSTNSGSQDEDKSICDDYYDDWDDEDEAEENLYDYYGEEGSDDYWDEEE